MTPILTLFSLSPDLIWPQGLMGWSVFVIILGFVIYLGWKARKFQAQRRPGRGLLIAFLVAASMLANLFLGVSLPAGMALAPPGTPTQPLEPAIMFFSAIPWMLSAGIFGPIHGALMGALAGLFRALWHTHNAFTPLETALLAIAFGAAIRQNYRTVIFRRLRHPMIAGFALAFAYVFIHIACTPWIARGEIAHKLDYALSNMPGAILATGAELLIAGFFLEILFRLIPSMWLTPGLLRPSPAERSLQNRFLAGMAPFAFLLVFALLISDWYYASKVARKVLQEQMSSAVNIAAENIPFFFQTGQNLITSIGTDTNLWSEDVAVVSAALTEAIRSVPFFNQLTVLDTDGSPIASYPSSDFIGDQAPIEEQVGVHIVLNSKLPFQTFTIPPTKEQTTAQVSFVLALFDENKAFKGILIGRSDLASNPITQPILASLESTAGDGGYGLLVDAKDGKNRILVHPNPNLIMSEYKGSTKVQDSVDLEITPDGTRQYVLVRPAIGHDWTIILAVPASRIQTLSLEIATPTLLWILLLSFLAVLSIHFGIGRITKTLQNLAGEADQLAHGKLNQPLQVEGEDEVGQLRRAFEQMRLSLKARLDELNRLLVVSQGVASSLEMSESVQPVLESAVASGASMARVVLTPSVIPGLGKDSNLPVTFSIGSAQHLYHELDDQILSLTQGQERLVLSNVNRPRLLEFSADSPKPESVLAVAMRHENKYYGALWAAFDKPHTFSEEQVRFMVTLASQAALAAANNQLFMNTEIGRQRLEAILASSPDPVLVIDQHDCLSLANPAARQALGLGIEVSLGQAIDQVVAQAELLEILRSPDTERDTREVLLPDHKVYLATATPVMTEGQRVGRVCILRDVTHFKELDTLKSDFVSTVSHDLRSPLTLMRGYATMLEMVGQLNEQQTGYVRKIIGGVDSMSRLVNNLLDLGRIEAGVGLQPIMLSVQDVVEKVVSGLQLQAAQKRIKLTIAYPQQALPMIEADQALLQQALQNLVENAIKYTRNEGKVTIQVRVQPTFGMVFEVIDNGVGISPMDLPRLFEKFYRGAQQSTKESKGTGLGLAIVKSIAERHGGQVWAESQLGKGSVFRLAIPIRQTQREIIA